MLVFLAPSSSELHENVCRKAIVALKTLNCIIIPACLKYADNILYGYAKPLSIAPRRFMATPTQGRAQTGQFLIGRIGDVAGSRISSPEMDWNGWFIRVYIFYSNIFPVLFSLAIKLIHMWCKCNNTRVSSHCTHFDHHVHWSPEKAWPLRMLQRIYRWLCGCNKGMVSLWYHNFIW